jgi:hypothetical protein
MYSIGQILFFVLSKKSQVYPMQVVEIITKKNLSGEEATYVLQAGPEKETKLTLDQVDGEVFESPDVLRQTLVHRASMQVNKLIDNAVDKSNKWYSGTKSHAIPQTIQNLPDFIARNELSIQQSHSMNQKNNSEDEEDDSTVTMPDGSVVRVKLPKF